MGFPIANSAPQSGTLAGLSGAADPLSRLVRLESSWVASSVQFRMKGYLTRVAGAASERHFSISKALK